MHQDFSFWEHDAYSGFWDMVIIGGGITGLSAGISILERQPESKVLIVDRWFIPLGASTRNAGFACFGSPSEILDDVRHMGQEAAISLIRKRWLGLQKLRTRLGAGYEYFESHGGYEVCHQEEYDQLFPQLKDLNGIVAEATGIENVFTTVRVPAGIDGFSGAFFNAHEGQLHPGHMIKYLTRKYLSLGGKLWTGLSIDRLESSGSIVRLLSSLSFPLETRCAIVTINAFARQLLPHLDIHGARNHVLVTAPVKDLSWKGCFHHDRGFYYFRNIGDRILLGGARNQDLENENSTEFGRNPRIVEALEHFLYTHLTRAETPVEYQWSGIIGIGKDKSPIIASPSPGIIVGVRLSGMGIALASLIGDELADMALQQEA